MAGTLTDYRISQTVTRSTRRIHQGQDQQGRPVIILDEMLPPGVTPEAPEASYAHPNLPRVLDWFHTGRGIDRCVVLERPDGQTLSNLLEQAPFPVSDCLAVGRQLAAAVAFLHSRAIPYVLGTLRAEDVHVDGSRVVLEFTGSALLAAGIGPYVAPEVTDERRSPQSDVYSVAALMVHMLTGQTPRPGAARVPGEGGALFRRSAVAKTGIPAELAMVLAQALQRRPDQRFVSAETFLQALERVAVDWSTKPLITPVAASAHSHPGRGTGLAQGARALLRVTLIAALAAIVVGAAWWLLPQLKAAEPHPQPSESTPAITEVRPPDPPATSVTVDAEDRPGDYLKPMRKPAPPSEEQPNGGPTPWAVPIPKSPPPPVPAIAAGSIESQDASVDGTRPIPVSFGGQWVGRSFIYLGQSGVVISVDAYNAITNHHLRWTVRADGKLLMWNNNRQVVTADFRLIEGRPWLLLTPDLQTQLGIRVITTDSGVHIAER